MVNTLNGLEKAIAVMKLQSQKTADRIEVLSAKLDDFICEFRASLASHLMTCPKLSKHSSEGPIAAVRIAEKQPKISPTANNITAAAAAVVSPYPSAAMASKYPPDEVPFPKLSVASNGQPPKEHKVSILGETASECGLKVPDVFVDPYMGIVSVSAPLALEFNNSSHVSSERQMKHSAKELCFSRSLFGASSHKPGNQLGHRPYRQINIYKLEFEPPPDLHLRICLALRTRLF